MCVPLRVPHRTIVVSIEVELPTAVLRATSTFVVWALAVPQQTRSFADGVYSVIMPVPLGYVTFATAPASRPVADNPPCSIAVLSLGRWELSAGTRLALALTAPDADPANLWAVMDGVARGLRAGEAQPTKYAVLNPLIAPRWRLCGSQMPAADPPAEAAEWQPLLHRRWYELKSYVRQGTAVPYFTTRRPRGDSDSDREEEGDGAEVVPMYAGDVREAEAISLNRHCILWADGGVGLYDEVKPFYRVYQPARPDKTIRVRRFPHRYADIVGEIPFGQRVEACGRATDPFTQEQYVLLFLPPGDAFAHHRTTYDLTFVEDGRYVWGWSKLAGTSGLPLLMEGQGEQTELSKPLLMAATHASGGTTATTSSSSTAREGMHATSSIKGCTDNNGAASNNAAGQDGLNSNGSVGKGSEVMELPEGTFYTPVREGRPVRIRKRPTLTAATIREMEVNEVRAATALVTVVLRTAASPASDGSGVPHVFVQWQQGGYSLLRSEVECFLVPVVLSRVPRRFPIRTRSSGNIAAGAAGTLGEEEEEVIDLSRPRKRPRNHRRGAGAGDDQEGADSEAELAAMLHRRPKTVVEDESLLSPYSLPASLQEGLRRGVVRLEDLPPLRQLNDEEMSEEEEDGDESDASETETEDSGSYNDDW